MGRMIRMAARWVRIVDRVIRPTVGNLPGLIITAQSLNFYLHMLTCPVRNAM